MTLIERLEAGETGSRELSDECLLAVGWARSRDDGWGTWQAPDRKVYGFNRPDPSQNLQDSLDWMVPEGLGRGCFALSRERSGRTHATVWYNAEFNRKTTKHGADPALALCAASLRAREAIKEKDDE